MTYEESRREAELLRNAINALEDAEFVRELNPAERTKLATTKTALEHALLRLAIKLLENAWLGD